MHAAVVHRAQPKQKGGRILPEQGLRHTSHWVPGDTSPAGRHFTQCVVLNKNGQKQREQSCWMLQLGLCPCIQSIFNGTANNCVRVALFSSRCFYMAGVFITWDTQEANQGIM